MASVFNRGTRDRPMWYAKIKIDGVWKMLPTHQTSKVEARRWAEEREARLAAGKPLEEPKPEQERTFGECLDYWLRTHSAVALVSHHDNELRAKVLREAFGRLPVSHVTAVRIAEFRAAKLAEKTKDPKGGEIPARSPATVNRYLGLLRKVMNDSALWGFVPSAPRVKLMKVPKQPFKFLLKAQAEALLSWSQRNAPEVFPLYALAVGRGLRMGELYGLRWCDLDLDRRMVVVCRSYARDYPKDKEPRTVPIDESLAAILRQWRTVCPSTEFVFPFDNGQPRLYPKAPRGFESHLKAVGCPRVRFHDLRHTAASLMVMAGASLQSVQVILGHSTIAMTERYAHHSAEHVAREAAKLSFSIQTSPGPASPSMVGPS